jgi:phosphate transport system substrate-binding protein
MKKAFRHISEIFDMTIVLPSIVGLIALLLTIKVFAAVQLNGAGATFPEPIYSKWFSEYQKTDKEVAINYQGIGSGGGIKQLISGTVDFGASDSPMTAEEVKSAPQPVIHIPMVLGAVVVSYNLKLDKPLKLTGPNVADIFSGKITKWNDPAIAKTNPGLKLPDQAIVVATRSDGSGTTAVFSDYLAKVSPDWEGKVGKTVNWFKGSVGAKGNAGVTGLIKQAEGAIGYIELVYALENKLPFALIQNKAGQYPEASLKTVSDAAAGFVKDMEKNDFKMSITNAPGKSSYPISTFTWILAYEKMDKEKGQQLVKVLKWALGDQGQKIAEELNYAPVPKALRSKIIAKIGKIQFK